MTYRFIDGNKRLKVESELTIRLWKRLAHHRPKAGVQVRLSSGSTIWVRVSKLVPVEA